MKFSGHESFACRYAWLPKACQAILDHPNSDDLLGDDADSAILFEEDRAMVELGIGKNMVRSLRFWVETLGVAEVTANRTHRLTPFGRAVFGPDGFDRYLEDRRTLWLLHWNVSTYGPEPVFAWHYLLNHWPHPELSRTEVVSAFLRESECRGYKHSEVTLSQHFDVFLHTYVATRGSAKAEDSLDGPLVELRMLEPVGERRAGSSSRRETVYAFRRDPKPDITRALFEYCLHQYWKGQRAHENTLTYRDVALHAGSIGQVFKLPEEDIRARLDRYASDAGHLFRYQASAVQGLLFRTGEARDVETLLARVYASTPSNAHSLQAA
jgi:hypothetical protein